MTLDLTPLYRNSVGFDGLARLLDAAFSSETQSTGYPPYNIEVIDEHEYAITLAVAGFERDEIELEVERGILRVSGKKTQSNEARKFLYQGIAARSFERKFDLADHVEVTEAELVNGLLTIRLLKRIPEEMKPKRIAINGRSQTPSMV